MHIIITAFTRQGVTLAKKLSEDLNGTLYLPKRLSDEMGFARVDEFAERGFAQFDALIFVGACGIAVRAIAPYIRDKFTDPAVVSVDELGQFVVPLLSGHVGGANHLAKQVAKSTGGQAVISTATDLQDKFAVDVWAKNHHLDILDRTIAKEISAHILEGNSVGFTSQFSYTGELPAELQENSIQKIGICISNRAIKPYAKTLSLVPKILTLGIGCRRGTSCQTIQNRVSDVFAQYNLVWDGVCAICTIDRKGDEIGLLEFCEMHKLTLQCYTAEELQAVEGEFTASQFVLNTVGVDNVCERSACMGGNTLLVSKQSGDGVTVAVSTGTIALHFGQEEHIL